MWDLLCGVVELVVLGVYKYSQVLVEGFALLLVAETRGKDRGRVLLTKAR